MRQASALSEEKDKEEADNDEEVGNCFVIGRLEMIFSISLASKQIRQYFNSCCHTNEKETVQLLGIIKKQVYQ